MKKRKKNEKKAKTRQKTRKIQVGVKNNKKTLLKKVL